VPSSLVFRLHALQRMFQRRISAQDVRRVLETGELIEDYPHDTPYPEPVGARMVWATSRSRGGCGQRNGWRNHRHHRL
jgi:hypothetical protein